MNQHQGSQEAAPMPETVQDEGRHYRADQPLGDILRQERERYGWSLQQVEDVLRIRACQLEALENGRHDLLPGRVYVIGFVRSYAECLGFNPDEAVALFKRQYSANGQVRPSLNFPVPASESKLPNMRILGGAAVALVVLVALGVLFTGGDKEVRLTQNDIPAVPEALKTDLAMNEGMTAENLAALMPAVGIESQTDVVSPQAEESGAQDAPASVSVPQNIVIAAVDNVWLEVRNQAGQVILSQVLNKGDRYIVPAEDAFFLDTGDIAGLNFIVAGETIIPAGKSGDVRRNIALTPDAVKALASPQ